MNKKLDEKQTELKTETEETKTAEISAEELREVTGGYQSHQQAMTCGDYNI